MYDVMQGVRVVEVAEHTFVPAASMILADWGADVIKIERAAGGGDAARTMRAIQTPGLRANPFFEAANRGKRSVGLDLTQAEGREQLYKLLAGADVFITNMRDDARVQARHRGRRSHEAQPSPRLRQRHRLREARSDGPHTGIRLSVVVVPVRLRRTPRPRPTVDRRRGSRARWVTSPVGRPSPGRSPPRCSGGSGPGAVPSSIMRFI